MKVFHRISQPMVKSTVLLVSALAAIVSVPIQAHPLTIDDVLSTVVIDSVAPSPDGRELAVSLQRPANKGEVGGRTFYEVDPSRNDIWLVSRDGQDVRNLTTGHSLAAGYWCPQWSPDGQHIAMLSSRPEGTEPHGGDSARLYVWKHNEGNLVRLSAQPMMTMTRYGSPLNALDLREGGGGNPLICSVSDENAPFLWLDAHRLLVVQMPAGQNSALFTQNGLALDSASVTAHHLRGGQVSTADISDSDRSKLAGTASAYQGEIALVDTDTGVRYLLARVPAFPFRGMLSIVVSPDRNVIAILAPAGVIPPKEVGQNPFNNDETQSAKQVILVDVRGKVPPHRITMPEEAIYPLDLLEWSGDSTALLLRARGAGNARDASVFRLDVASQKVTPVAPEILTSPNDAGPSRHEHAAKWDSGNRILIRGHKASETTPPENWWLVTEGKATIAASGSPPKKVVPVLPKAAQILAQDRHGIIWQELTDKGLALREQPTRKAPARTLLTVNPHLSDVSWGSVSTVEYDGESGQPLKALVILPPSYRKGERYPTLVWVYPGTMIRGSDGYWADRLLPGIYNLQLYAAKGYIVVIPSMPLDRSVTDGPYTHMKGGVIPAVDKLISMGIADPQRIGVFGQSFGGYATYALVAQTNKFAAAAAIAGITDMQATYGSFDRGADGWSGIAQDKSVNTIIATTAMRMPKPAYADPGVYATNSPVNYASAIQTPLLIAHGSLDTRGGVGEAETMFTLLDQQGKPTRLLRYQGENHAIALSPANVRHLFGELIDWFDTHLRPKSQMDK